MEGTGHSWRSTTNKLINQSTKTMGTYFNHFCRQDLVTFSFWVNFAINPFHSAYRSIIGFSFHGMWTALDILINVGLQNEVILSTGMIWLQHFNKGRNLSQSIGRRHSINMDQSKFDESKWTQVKHIKVRGGGEDGARSTFEIGRV